MNAACQPLATPSETVSELSVCPGRDRRLPRVYIELKSDPLALDRSVRRVAGRPARSLRLENSRIARTTLYTTRILFRVCYAGLRNSTTLGAPSQGRPLRRAADRRGRTARHQ